MRLKAGRAGEALREGLKLGCGFRAHGISFCAIFSEFVRGDGSLLICFSLPTLNK